MLIRNDSVIRYHFWSHFLSLAVETAHTCAAANWILLQSRIVLGYVTWHQSTHAKQESLVSGLPSLSPPSLPPSLHLLSIPYGPRGII